jgi:3-dehydroquinate synthase
MHIERVELGSRSYSIAITSNAKDAFVPFVRERLSFKKAIVVCDSNTEHQGGAIADQLQSILHIVPAGEASKCMVETARLYDTLAALAADRKTPVVAVGGGVIGDLAGFAAATYNRGIPLVMVPTTLLAMVDSSVGGKVGINLPSGKNLVGSFHQPACVWIDTANLESLPEREYRSGLAEVVKYGMILDADFFQWMEANASAALNRDPAAIRHMVARSCRLKADVVEKDEREENGLRMALNYGHTFAHAFEAIGGYGSWLHGEAVAAGMVGESRLAEARGTIASDVTQRQIELLRRLSLPTEALSEWPIDDLLTSMRRDKKNVAGQLRFILPTRIGNVQAFDDIPESMVRAVLKTRTGP